jgi:hypothetical protein
MEFPCRRSTMYLSTLCLSTTLRCLFTKAQSFGVDRVSTYRPSDLTAVCRREISLWRIDHRLAVGMNWRSRGTINWTTNIKDEYYIKDKSLKTLKASSSSISTSFNNFIIHKINLHHQDGTKSTHPSRTRPSRRRLQQSISRIHALRPSY